MLCCWVGLCVGVAAVQEAACTALLRHLGQRCHIFDASMLMVGHRRCWPHLSVQATHNALASNTQCSCLQACSQGAALPDPLACCLAVLSPQVYHVCVRQLLRALAEREQRQRGQGRPANLRVRIAGRRAQALQGCTSRPGGWLQICCRACDSLVDFHCLQASAALSSRHSSHCLLKVMSARRKGRADYDSSPAAFLPCLQCCADAQRHRALLSGGGPYALAADRLGRGAGHEAAGLAPTPDGTQAAAAAQASDAAQL